MVLEPVYRILFKRGVFSMLLLFIVAVMVGGLLLHLNRMEKQQYHYKQHTEMLEMAYRAALHNHQMTTDIYLQDTIRQPAVLALFSRAWKSSESEKALLRRSLYAKLEDSYQSLWQYHLRQLHFHLPDGESFLRFYQPDHFGDKLFPVRPSVRIVNTEHRTVTGFEVGRTVEGFRYVAPLSWQGVPIGSVETSIPFRPLQSAMSEYAPDREYQFLVNAELIHDRLSPDFRSEYAQSAFSDAWLVENPARKSPDSARQLSAPALALAATLRNNTDVIRQMAAYQPFSVGLVQQGVGYVVSFLPVKEVTGGRGGYLVCYAKEPLVMTFKRGFLIELTAFVCLLSLLFWLLLRWRGSVAELAEQTARLQYDEVLLTQQERVEHEERTRISRELHDGIGQALHAVSLRLKLLLSGMNASQTEEREAVGQLINDLQNTTSELRNLVVSLRPLPLSGMQVDEAIRWMCRKLEKEAGLSLLLQITGEYADISDHCSLALFRTCQEGLQNIMKHAEAKRVQVLLQRQGDMIAMTIIDDGVGGAEPGKDGGLGLKIMQERVELAHGFVRIDSHKGQGTTLLVELPCR